MIDNTTSCLLGSQVVFPFGNAQDHEAGKPVLLMQVQFGEVPCGSKQSHRCTRKKLITWYVQTKLPLSLLQTASVNSGAWLMLQITTRSNVN